MAFDVSLADNLKKFLVITKALNMETRIPIPKVKAKPLTILAPKE